MNNENSKAKKIAILALVLALVSIGASESSITTVNNTTTNITKMTYTGAEYTSSVEVSDASTVMKVVDGNTVGIYITPTDINWILDGTSMLGGSADGIYVTSLSNPNNSHVCASSEGLLNIGCASDNTKVNKSGDTMTGMLNASGGLTAPNFTIGAAIPITFGVVAGTMARAGDIVISRSATDRLLIGSGTFGSSSYVVVGAENLLYPVQKPTASAPTYHIGAMYFDTTLNKLRIGGATGWETVTSI